MRICVKVAEIESFAETARHMNMSAPAVTRAVAALEDLIGVRLFVRTTRSVKMTEAGTRYFSDCRRILADIAEAEATAGGTYATPTGTLAITASALFGQMYVLPIVIGYLDAYPSVRALTLFVDRPINMIKEGVDVAVRIGHLPDSSFIAVKVGTVRHVVCGAPHYFEEHGVPANPADLRDQRLGLDGMAVCRGSESDDRADTPVQHQRSGHYRGPPRLWAQIGRAHV